MYENFLPIRDLVLVKLPEKEEKSSSGIYLPPDSQENKFTAEVVNKGNSIELFKGDIIAYKRYAGHPLDDQYLVLEEKDILGVISERL